MLKIADFFKKIQSKHAQELFLRSTIQTAIKKYTQIELPIESISLKNSDILLRGISQTARSVIFIKKEMIMGEINSLQQIRLITSIR